MLYRLIIPLCACLFAVSSSGQDLRDLIVVRSRTGQFTIRAKRRSGLPERPPLVGQSPVAGTSGFVINPAGALKTGSDDKIDLEPALLAVSCERIKEMLLHEVAQNDQWRGRIDVFINASMRENDEPRLTAVYRPEGWTYQLMLPKTLSPKELVRVLVHTLFLEIANRQAGGNSAEPPAWLVEGVAANLQAYNLPTYVVEPKAEMFGNRIKLDGLSPVREALSHHAPLTFEQLSWPDAATAGTPEQEKVWRASAQLFVYNLFRMKNGQACLARTLQRLPQHANWQLAFLEGYHSHFAELRDVEKWWGLACVNFTGRDLLLQLSKEEAWRKFRQALDVPVEVHLRPDRLPTEADITLQEVIMQWEDKAQLPALQRTLQVLADLRPRVPKEIAGLVDKYQNALQGYLQQRQSVRPALSTKNVALRFEGAKATTCRQLNRLDQERESLRARVLPNRREAETAALEQSEGKPAPASPVYLASPKSR